MISFTFKTLAAHAATIVFMAVGVGCSLLPAVKSDAAADPAGKSNATPGPGASVSVSGMNDRGEVVDSKKVEMGHGVKAKGIDDWEGEVLGKPAPGTPFAKVEIGMEMPDVEALIGPASDKGTRMSGSMFNPFYFGADKYKRELVYKGMGRLVFGERGGWGRNNGGNLIWIIHNANEPGER